MSLGQNSDNDKMQLIAIPQSKLIRVRLDLSKEVHVNGDTSKGIFLEDIIRFIRASLWSIQIDVGFTDTLVYKKDKLDQTWSYM